MRRLRRRRRKARPSNDRPAFPIARAAGWSYLFKNYVLKDWVTFTEVFGQPLRLGKYGTGATEADKQALLTAVANIGTDAAAIIPESMVIEFIAARQNGSADQ